LNLLGPAAPLYLEMKRM